MTTEEEREAKKKAREEYRKEMAMSYKRTFLTEDGQAVMNDLHTVFGLDMPEMISTATKPGDRIEYDMGYIGIRSGQRQVMMHIQKQIKIAVAPEILTRDATVRTE